MTVTIGDRDEMAREKSHDGKRVSKLHTQRAAQPTFDEVVEVKSELHDQWRVTLDSGMAVDSILESRKYTAQVGALRDWSGMLRCCNLSLVEFSISPPD